MIRNDDGTPFQVTGDRTQFDPSSPMNKLMDQWDAESIKIGGSPLYYYEVFINDIDPVYHEARNKVWSNNPIELYCYYEPNPSQNAMNVFGYDDIQEQVFYLNASAVKEALNGPPKIGSRLFTPHLRNNWELIQVNTGEYKMWNVFHYEFICKKFQESLTTGEGKVTQKSPQIKII